MVMQSTPRAREARMSGTRRLEKLVKSSGSAKFARELFRLPKPVRLSVKEAIVGLFPDNGYLMLTPKRNWHGVEIRVTNGWRTMRGPSHPCLSKEASSEKIQTI